jgi:CheY-like chemotaxis protein
MPRPRILVVDDEPLVGRAVKRVLSSQSDVSCSTSAAEALAILGDPANRFDLILCDLMMPDMNGPQFRSALLCLLPHMEHRLIFITGGAFTPDMDQFLAQSSCPYVLKPFDVPELRSLVASRLAAA